MFESMEEKNFSFFRFEDLRIYHKALDFVTFVYGNTAAFPEDLKRDFLDTSNSIVLSIAQGSFYGKPQFVNILKDVRTAIRACVVYTTIGHRIGAFSESQNEESTTHLMELSKMLGAFIGSLKKQTDHANTNELSSDIIEID
jgi:four helix bundle protein